MKKVMVFVLVFFISSLFSFNYSIAAPVTVIIYGKGGVQLIPPKICPQESNNKCAEVKFNSAIPTDPSGNPIFVGQVVEICYRNVTFPNIIISEQPDYIRTPTGYEIYGGLRIDSDEQTLLQLQQLGEPSEPECPGF